MPLWIIKAFPASSIMTMTIFFTSIWHVLFRLLLSSFSLLFLFHFYFFFTLDLAFCLAVFFTHRFLLTFFFSHRYNIFISVSPRSAVALIPFDLTTFVQSNNCLTILSNKKTKKKVSSFLYLHPSIHPFTNNNLTCKYPICAFKGLFFCTFFNSTHYLLKVHALTGVYAADAVTYYIVLHYTALFHVLLLLLKELVGASRYVLCFFSSQNNHTYIIHMNNKYKNEIIDGYYLLFYYEQLGRLIILISVYILHTL